MRRPTRVRRGTLEWERLQQELSAGKRRGRSGGTRKSKNDDAAVILERSGLGGFVREYRFHPTRRWEIDFVWEDEKVALEVEGVNHYRSNDHPGEHRSVEGFARNCEKYSEIALAGYLLIRVTTDQVEGAMVPLVCRALAVRRGGKG